MKCKQARFMEGQQGAIFQCIDSTIHTPPPPTKLPLPVSEGLHCDRSLGGVDQEAGQLGLGLTLEVP